MGVAGRRGVAVHEIRGCVDVVVGAVQRGVVHIAGQVGQHRIDVGALGHPAFDVRIGEMMSERVRCWPLPRRGLWQSSIGPDLVEHGARTAR